MDESTLEKLVEHYRQYIGRPCLVLDPHPNAGKCAEVIDVTIPKGTLVPGMVVRLETGKECMIFDSEQLLFF